MPGVNTISARVAEELGQAGLLTSEQLAWAVAQAASTGQSAGRLVFERQFVTESDIARVLEEALGVVRVDLASYTPDEDAVTLVPAELARYFRTVPMFEIDGVLTVAIGRASDVFGLDDLAEKTGLEIEAVLAEESAIAAALAHCYGTVEASGEAASHTGEPSGESLPFIADVASGSDPTTEVGDTASGALAHASGLGGGKTTADDMPLFDLDVLAVSDVRRTSLLVNEVLEAAVARRASDLHVLPYKEDFFLTARVNGRLVQLGHAPLSMQSALLDGFRAFLKMAPVSDGPAVGRIQTEIGGVPVSISASLVMTLAGQRLVLNLDYRPAVARPLDELGMSSAEVKAVRTLLERGRGLVIVAAPIGEGGSDTYHAMIGHAAISGRTVYSVERGGGIRIPAVAQVLALDTAMPDARAYLAAGLGQDVDVIAIEQVSSAGEMHLALEAAGKGKLVVAGITAASSLAAIRALAGMGTEPVSLAGMLALVISQRRVRTASGDEAALFELLPATAGVRSAVAAGASAADLEAAAHESGVGVESLKVAG